MDIQEIIHKLGTASPLSQEEQTFLDTWLENTNNRQQFREWQHIQSAVFAIGMSKKINCDKEWDRLLKRISPRKRTFGFLPHAAAAILIASLGILLWRFTQQIQTAPNIPEIKEQVIPGKKQGILTLSTGQQIALSDHLPTMTEKNGTTIQNTGQQLVYTPADTAAPLVYNTITIPRSGEYKLTLSDGSTVWINSESEITYPVNFKGDKREIRLKGEAFFEVQKDNAHPFIVQTDQFSIRVMGTRFNVRSYPHEIPLTTLTQGHIRLEKDKEIAHLVPGQQAALIEGKIHVKEVNIEEAVAWRNEAFCFKQRPLESLLNEIARWYDIDIVYQDHAARHYHYTAWFRRNTPIEELIKILEKTQLIKLELKEKTLIVKTNHP